ncbi:MAG TPA: hypothetical protein ENI42_00830 [Thermoplasmatales archaeon]|nr:hypothetical protein [Thermoplasmatales archaeon]
MLETLDSILPYISGMWTLPWILIGFILTTLLSKFIERSRIDAAMKKIGLILLYFFVPVLLFRIFLNTDLGVTQIEFVGIIVCILFFMYLLAYYFAKHKAAKLGLKGKTRQRFIKTVVTNQGRSSAFIGSAMLAVPAFRVPAGLYMSLVGIMLFAVIPYILSHIHHKGLKKTEEPVHALPWFLKLYPWYLIVFVAAGVILHNTLNVDASSLGDTGRILLFYSALTIPAALYYVGAGIHPSDLKKDEIKKLVGLTSDTKDHWPWVKNIFFLTVILTPLATMIIFGGLTSIGVIPLSWFGVILINSFLPITSTNMFLVPYGIDKKTTALAVTWTTIVCVPIVVLLIYLFSLVL